MAADGEKTSVRITICGSQKKYTYVSEKDAVEAFTPQPLFHITGGTQKKSRTFQSRY